MPVPARAYEMFANGEISGEELLELEKFAEELEKSAAGGVLKPQILRHAPETAALLGGLALAAPTLAYVGSSVPGALQAGVNKIRFERGLQRAVEVNPQLGTTDDPNLRMAYKTLQTLNPQYAKDPLIAGTILDMVTQNRMDPNDPSSAPRFDPTLLSEIQKNVARTPDTAGQVAGVVGKTVLDG